jgi:hypothetical protein
LQSGDKISLEGIIKNVETEINETAQVLGLLRLKFLLDLEIDDLIRRHSSREGFDVTAFLSQIGVTSENISFLTDLSRVT